MLKIHVPEIIKHQYHTHYVFIHKHAPPPKKEPKKKPVKPHHIKHIYIPVGHGHHKKHVYKSHKHVTTHKHPIVIHKPVIIHKHVQPHKKKPVKEVHKMVPPPPPPPPPSPPSKKHHDYEVTEDYDEDEDPTIYQFDPDDYTIPGDLKDPHVEKQPESYNVEYFSYPNTMNSGMHGYYGSPEITSYDISPYHRPKNEEVHYDFDYSRPPESEFEFRKDIFHKTQTEERGENYPIYTQHRRRFINEINDVQEKKFADENIEYSNNAGHNNKVNTINQIGIYRKGVVA